MPTVTVPQVNPNDEVTALSVNQGPNALASVVNGQLDDANINTISGSKISAGTLPASAADTNSNPETRESETVGDIVASGLIWSATSGLTGSMTAGVAYVNGKRLAVSAVASYVFTATRDTYVYVDSNGVIQYNPLTVGTAQPTTPAGNILLAKVVTSASAITSVLDLRVTNVSEVWRTWTPTLTGITPGNGTTFARFKQVGKTVNARFRFTFGSSSDVTGAITFTLPVQTASNYVQFDSMGVATFYDAGANIFLGYASRGATADVIDVSFYNVSGSTITRGVWATTVPFDTATGDFVSVQLTYEAA